MQVFTNLIGNAAKFVRRGTAPRIVISADRRAERVRVNIRDNGIGIPPEMQSRVFGMFERLHASAEYEGTGIGLAIVRKAIERMGGLVGVDSDGENGSTFWVELPAAPVAANGS
jgi:signal transduction histidine kinase